MEPLTKRQQEILKYLTSFIDEHGHGPTLNEICRNFGLASASTAHKHLKRLQTRGWIKREKNHARSIRVVPATEQRPGIGIPLRGDISESKATPTQDAPETITVPEDLVARDETYALRVHGDKMLDEQLHDGDIITVENRATANNGETVLALIDGSTTTVRTFHEEDGQVRLQPDDPGTKPVVVDANRVQVQGIAVGMIRNYSRRANQATILPSRRSNPSKNKGPPAPSRP